MSQDSNDTVGGRPLEACVSVTAGTRIEAALGQAADWILVQHEGQVVALLHRSDLEGLPEGDLIRSVVPEAPTVVVADRVVPVADLLASTAVQSVRPAAVAVMDGDKPVGIWSEDALLETSVLGVARYGSDTMLPGQIKIPPIVKRCQFTTSGQACGAVRSFASRPGAMPPCDDPRHLGAHPFGW